jgi:predicted RNase H-like nuclease
MIKDYVLGIDGCRAGWVAASIHLPSGKVEITLFFTMEQVWNTFGPSCALALIDMPIGLIDHGPEGRSCDRLARRLLSPYRHSSIFTPPCRAALYAPTDQASEVNFERTGKRLSRQTINIMPKMREVDQWLRSLPASDRDRIRESHPEILFTALNEGRPLMSNKKQASGKAERLALLPPHLADVNTILSSARQNIPSKDAAWDDLIDALVLSLAARIALQTPEKGRSLPEIPVFDGEGLPMAIFYISN